MEPQKKKQVLVIAGAVLLIVAVILVAILSYIGGLKQKVEQEQQAAQRVVELQHPAPKPTLVLVGTVVDANSLMIAFTTNDPKDYLPHADGTPNATVKRIVIVGKTTKLETLLMSKQDATGSPTSQPLKLSALKAGDSIRVTADHDILSELQINAPLSVQRLVY